MCIDTERENGSSINFIFILLPSPALDKMYCVLYCSSQENDATYDVLIYSNFFVNGKFTESFHFCMFWPFFFCFTHACVCQVLLVDCNIAIATYIWEFLLYECNFGGGVALYSGMPTLTFCAWLDFLFTVFICSLSDHKYSYSQVTPSFWLCLCTKSRLCCMHFSYH